MISCLCPTFVRVRLLEEALYSFLIQDYTDSELIIVNDMPRQKLMFDHHRVTVVNLPERCSCLGAKRNTTAALASGSRLMAWDDDDIYLSNRVGRLVREHDKGTHKLIQEGSYYTLHRNTVVLHKRSPPGMHLVSAADFTAVGGFPLMNCGEDNTFVRAFKTKFPNSTSASSEEAGFIYRWSGSNRSHISAHGRDNGDKRSGWDILFDKANTLIDAGYEPSGEYTLRPRWRADYNVVRKGVFPTPL